MAADAGWIWSTRGTGSGPSALDVGYRAWLVPLRAARLRLLMIVVLVGNMGLAFSDFLHPLAPEMVWPLFCLRLVVVVFTFQALYALRRVSSVQSGEARVSLDHLEAVWGVALLSCALAINSTRPTVTHLGIDSMMVMAIFVSLRGPRFCFALALPFCVADVSIAIGRDLPLGEVASLTFALTIGCVVGALAAKALEPFLRQRFLDSLETHTAGDGDLLAMCAYCDSVRYPVASNNWLRPMEYLAATSSLQISHGICPDCFGSGSHRRHARLPARDATASSVRAST